ncbi:ferrous iron transporter B [Tindallia californiensis]|uniref:Ferrous iron transport protein B n=1 Tax=Tindallia californiensis TaxID=159292 RepID=A0A1H3J769_9FIRM|nr:ferrous iron transporter B [Tindallia californiensis]SDY35034.1 ferrous iron transport protein B [Tindallia californiensis]
MNCHSTQSELEPKASGYRILLMGNPNVGKSVIFSKLTGVEVESANYTGTTISFTKGDWQFRGKQGDLIDVPGTYSLDASSEAEKVAIDMLKQEAADAIVVVLDATNLERNLFFASQIQHLSTEILKKPIPVIFALNMIDVAKRQGIDIDVDSLQEYLDAPVISTVAVRNIGLSELMEATIHSIEENASFQKKEWSKSEDDRWIWVGKVIREVQQVEHRHPTWLEKLGDATMRPFPGIPIAFLVMSIALGIVVGGGKGLRGAILLPLVHRVIVPFLDRVVQLFVTEGILYNVLMGEYGMLVKGIEWPFALILPYVLLFYVVLSFMEDSGYLPRLGVLVDGVFRKIGIQGGNIVPMIMGYGCAIPAILGTRAATTQKERLMVASMVTFTVPCAAQTGAFIALLGDHSVFLLIAVYLVSFIAILVSGMMLNRFIPGKSDPMLLEIPNLLLPDRQTLIKKIKLRVKHFIVEAEVPMVLGVGFAALLAETGALVQVGVVLSPLVEGWLGLPPEATLGLILGIVRRELAVLPLLELGLSGIQLFTGAVVALFYMPCLAVLGVLVKEFGAKIGLLVGLGTTISAFVLGGLFFQIANIVTAIIG